MKHLLFFALKEDLLAMLAHVEINSQLKYARMGNFSHEDMCVFNSGAEIPKLGQASADSSSACEAFLVCERETPINVRAFHGTNGERVCVDQLVNPESVEFKPGGIWNGDIVLHGRIATASDSYVSQALMKQFHAAARKTFSKVKSYYVGPKALELLENGKRLTISAQSPHEFDLTTSNVKM